MISKEETLATIRKRYSNADFSESKAEGPEGIVFQNEFSFHVIFVVEDGEALQGQWQLLHQELIEAYRSFKGFYDVEWNFYCVFVVLTPTPEIILDQSRQKIESDTSYSRKFVFLGDELNHLPPGRMESRMEGGQAEEHVDPMGEWRSTLGDEIFERVCDATFAELKDVLTNLVREEAANGE